MNPTLRTIVPSLGMLVALTCGSGIAAAHTALSSSDPAPDATVTAAPAAIMLTFNEDISHSSRVSSSAALTVAIGYPAPPHRWRDSA